MKEMITEVLQIEGNLYRSKTRPYIKSEGKGINEDRTKSFTFLTPN